MSGKDVEEARSHVNFSNWDSYNPEAQEEFLTRIGSTVRTGKRPSPRYTLLHRDVVLAPLERRQIHESSSAEKKRPPAAGGSTSSFAIDTPSGLTSHNPTAAHPALGGSPHERSEDTAVF